jgi:hypothetical protein
VSGPTAGSVRFTGAPDGRVVDNRTFLLGLDELYRASIKRHERTELLSCARHVAAALGVAAADVPIEGYYAEDPSLAEYFRLVRALQNVGDGSTAVVEALPEFRRLRDVVSSPIYGRPQPSGKLIPTGRDALSEALRRSFPTWTVSVLVETAALVAREVDDISLVGLAARAGDPVVLAATRESVVLYAAMIAGSARIKREPTYTWNVEDGLCRSATRFVDTFNALFDEALPAPRAEHAELYWNACQRNRIHGRCVRLGYDDRATPYRHYHWGIRLNGGGGFEVHDFWDAKVWTTDAYRKTLGVRAWSQNPSP